MLRAVPRHEPAQEPATPAQAAGAEAARWQGELDRLGGPDA